MCVYCVNFSVYNNLASDRSIQYSHCHSQLIITVSVIILNSNVEIHKIVMRLNGILHQSNLQFVSLSQTSLCL